VYTSVAFDCFQQNRWLIILLISWLLYICFPSSAGHSSTFLSITFTFTYMCIHYLGHLLPVLVLWFCWRENISDNKKNRAFLIVWDKDSYTERFLVLLPHICVLQPILVHLYQTSLLLPYPLPIVASASLRLLYLLVYSEHINHIQVLGFFPFPYSSRVQCPLSV
jgi:hypothetical protein